MTPCRQQKYPIIQVLTWLLCLVIKWPDHRTTPVWPGATGNEYGASRSGASPQSPSSLRSSIVLSPMHVVSTPEFPDHPFFYHGQGAVSGGLTPFIQNCRLLWRNHGAGNANLGPRLSHDQGAARAACPRDRREEGPPRRAGPPSPPPGAPGAAGGHRHSSDARRDEEVRRGDPEADREGQVRRGASRPDA